MSGISTGVSSSRSTDVVGRSTSMGVRSMVCLADLPFRYMVDRCCGNESSLMKCMLQHY